MPEEVFRLPSRTTNKHNAVIAKRLRQLSAVQIFGSAMPIASASITNRSADHGHADGRTISALSEHSCCTDYAISDACAVAPFDLVTL